MIEARRVKDIKFPLSWRPAMREAPGHMALPRVAGPALDAIFTVSLRLHFHQLSHAGVCEVACPCLAARACAASRPPAAGGSTAEPWAQLWLEHERRVQLCARLSPQFSPSGRGRTCGTPPSLSLTTCLVVSALVGLGSVSAVAAQSPPSVHGRHPLVGSWLVTYDVEAFGVVIPILLSFGRDGVLLETDSPAPTPGGAPWHPDSEQWSWGVEAAGGARDVCLPLSQVDLSARRPHALRYHEDLGDRHHQRRRYAVRGDDLDRVPRHGGADQVVGARHRHRDADPRRTAVECHDVPGFVRDGRRDAPVDRYAPGLHHVAFQAIKRQNVHEYATLSAWAVVSMYPNG
jgi:hypothetical protein